MIILEGAGQIYIYIYIKLLRISLYEDEIYSINDYH